MLMQMFALELPTMIQVNLVHLQQQLIIHLMELTILLLSQKEIGKSKLTGTTTIGSMM